MPGQGGVSVVVKDWFSRIGSLSDHRLECSNCHRPERTRPLLAPFPMKANMIWDYKLKISLAYGERFADPGTGVVEQQQQSVVALARAGATVGLGQQAAHLVRLKESGQRTSGAFGRKCEHSRVLVGSGRVLTQRMLKEAAKCDTTAVARRYAVVPMILERLQKSPYHVGIQVDDSESRNRNSAAVGRKLQEESHGVAVCGYRMRARSAHFLQMSAEE